MGKGSGGGGSTQASSTSYQTNIPEYAQPYVTSMLNATQQQLFNVQDGQVQGFAPYVPYSANPADYVAGFSPMQNQAFQSAANLQTPGQFGYGSDLAAAAGEGALGTTGAAMGYGGAGYQAGLQGGAYAPIATAYGSLGRGYGDVGAGYGTTGSLAGVAGQQIGVGQGGMYGSQGATAGQLGQGLGISQGLNYAGVGAGYGSEGANIAKESLYRGKTSADIGMQAAQAAQQGLGAQAAYQAQATNPYAIQAYMNPYVQASLAPQLELMNQQLAQQQTQNQAQAVKQGAYGGSRQAVQQALSQQNMDLAKQQLIAQGYNQAFQQAQQAQQYGAGLGIQGLQAGTAALQTGIGGQTAAMQGVQGALAGTAQGMQGAQVGLQGAQTALQGTAQGMQGAGVGLQGAQTAMQGAGMGIQGAQAGMQGAGLGIQGAQTGLQGVQGALAANAQQLQGAQIGLQGVQGAQAGYGLANQAAGQLGQLGAQQLASQQGIIGLQNQLGGQQQAYQQQIINQAIQDYANAQQYPLMQLGTMSNMLRGLPLQSSTTQQYIAQPNMTTQAIGTLGAAGSLYGAMRKKGGIIDAKKMAKGGITSYDVGGSVRSKLYDMTPEQLKEELDSPSAEVRKMARGIMMEKQVQGKAGGGIIAFAGGTPDPEIIPQETATDTRYQAPAPAPAPAPRQAAPSAPVPTTSEGLKGFLAQESQRQFALANRPVAEGLAERRAYVGEDTAGQEYRKKIMEERANAGDEAVRNNWLRAAQFFADWGSRPGNTLAAGMMALKNSIPDVIADQKEQKKYLREIDKTLYELEKAARAERAGDYDAEVKHKEKAAEIGWKGTSELSAIIRSQEQIAGNIKAASISANRETDMKFLYNTKLKELTGGDPSKVTPAIEAQAAQWASNQAKGLPEQKLDYKRVADVQKEIGDSEKSGTISNLEKSRRLALVQAGTPEEKKAVNEDYDRRIADAKQEITNRIMQGGQPPATAQPAPTGAPAAYTKDSVTVGNKTYTRPENFTDAQWKAYKDSVGAK